jgi:hypothetical protein
MKMELKEISGRGGGGGEWNGLIRLRMGAGEGNFM